MKCFLLIVMLLFPSCLLADEFKVIENDTFSITIPNSWKISEDKSKKVLYAHSLESHDGWPRELLLVDYCIKDDEQKKVGLLQCNDCTKELFNELLKQPKNHDGPFDIESSTNESIIDYRSNIISEYSGKVSNLKCNENGQIYYILTTSRKPTETFYTIIKSVKLK
jgi:hypothetical protein